MKDLTDHCELNVKRDPFSFFRMKVINWLAISSTVSLCCFFFSSIGGVGNFQALLDHTINVVNKNFTVLNFTFVCHTKVRLVSVVQR